MAILRFDSVQIDGTTITDHEFVSGSGKINYTGDDTAVTTADGRVHNTRRAKNSSAEFSMYGNGMSFKTLAPGLGKVVNFYRGVATTPIATFTAVVACTYSSSENVSQMSVTCDPS